MNIVRGYVLMGALFLGVSAPASADPVRLTFEGIPDGTQLDTLSGLVFTNATVLTAGVSLNEFEFPPRSGENVIADLGGPLTIMLGAPAAMVEAYATYLTPVTFSAYDASGALLAAITSQWASNTAMSGQAGSSPNELLHLSVPGIARVTFSGASAGASFVLDDFAAAPVPEPATLVLCGTGAVLALRARVRRRKLKRIP